MKRFTIVGSILIVLLMIGTLVYVGMSPDFVAPREGGPGGEDTDSPVWGMSIEDLVDYLEAKGLWSREDMLPIAAGVATEAYVCNGAEIYWWDVDNLEEGSNEAAAYQDIVNGDPINLYQQGQSYMPVTRNGPFAIFTGAYNGDVDVILDAFTSFGQEDGGEADDRSDPVWSATMEELLSYMDENGFIDRSSALQLNLDGDFTDGYVANGAEFYWWDVNHLEEDSSEMTAYQSARNEQIIDLGNGYVIAVTTNGPFGLFTTAYDGDADALLEAFQAFGH